MRGSAVAVVLVVTAVVTPGVAGGAVSGGHETGAAADVSATGTAHHGTAGAAVANGTGPDQGIVQELRYRRVPGEPGTVEVRVDYRVGSDANAIVLYPPSNVSVVSAAGFEETDPGEYFVTEDLASASLTFRVDLRRETVADHVGRGVAADGWALVGVVPGTAYFSGETDAWEFGGSDRVTREFAVDGAGVVGDGTLMLGEHAVHERSAAGQRLRLVVPAGHEPARPPETVLDTLAFTARRLDVGARDDRVTAFFAPAPNRRALGLTHPERGGGQDVWLFAPGWGIGNTWIHEYVHTRQAYDPARNMRWFREASANYYEKLFALRAGVGSYDAFRRAVRTETAGGVLADPDTWAGGTRRARGQRVLAALDARIQRATGYERSLADVFRRLNDHEETVTLADFEDAVAAVAGTRMDAWIRSRVAGTAGAAFRDDPHAYTHPSGDGDPDGDGLTDGRERAAGTHPFRADTDDDGLADARELDLDTDPTAADTDGDGLTDGRERDLETDPTAADTDGDGLDDGTEVERGTDPVVADTDGDGLADGREPDLGADPTVADTDGDGLDDGTEADLGADPTASDTDDDGLADAREPDLGTDPTAADTDGDSLDDDRELTLDTDPTTADTDGDGLTDGRERGLETDPTAADTDGDGLGDGREREYGADPTVRDTDGDRLVDGREVALDADPTAVDTDGDGLADGREADLGTDPAASDTDDDGLADARELAVGTDPTSPTGPVGYWWARLTGLLPGGSVTVALLVLLLAGAAAGVGRRR